MKKLLFIVVPLISIGVHAMEPLPQEINEVEPSIQLTIANQSAKIISTFLAAHNAGNLVRPLFVEPGAFCGPLEIVRNSRSFVCTSQGTFALAPDNVLNPTILNLTHCDESVDETQNKIVQQFPYALVQGLMLIADKNGHLITSQQMKIARASNPKSNEIAPLQSNLIDELPFEDRLLQEYENEPAPPLPADELSEAQNEKLVRKHFDCAICFNQKPVSEIKQLACGHEYCRECIIELIDLFKKERQPKFLECPNAQCKKAFTEYDIEELNGNDRSAIDLLAEIRLQEWIATQPDAKHCPTPNCPYVFLSGNLNQIVICPSCSQKYCVNCLVLHNPADISCEAYKASLKDGKESLEWKYKNTKPCPRCDKAIEKNGGCQFINCIHCKKEFCWECLYACQRNHEPHPCKPISIQEANKKFVVAGINNNNNALVPPAEAAVSAVPVTTPTESAAGNAVSINQAPVVYVPVTNPSPAPLQRLIAQANNLERRQYPYNEPQIQVRLQAGMTPVQMARAMHQARGPLPAVPAVEAPAAPAAPAVEAPAAAAPEAAAPAAAAAAPGNAIANQAPQHPLQPYIHQFVPANRVDQRGAVTICFRNKTLNFNDGYSRAQPLLNAWQVDAYYNILRFHPAVSEYCKALWRRNRYNAVMPKPFATQDGPAINIRFQGDLAIEDIEGILAIANQIPLTWNPTQKELMGGTLLCANVA